MVVLKDGLKDFCWDYELAALLDFLKALTTVAKKEHSKVG